MNVHYHKCEPDAEALFYIGQHYTDTIRKAILTDLQNGFSTLIKVSIDKTNCGYIIARAEKSIEGEFIFVVLHVIRAQRTNEDFHIILGTSLFQYAESLGFPLIRQHADRRGLCKILEKYYNHVSEVVYLKRLKPCLAQNHPAVKAQALRTKTTESLMTQE
jgi:hypothetical protein